MAVVDAHMFPGFPTPVLTQLLFPKPPTTFLTCLCRGERRKHAGKKVRLNRGSHSQLPGHAPDTLTTEPPEWGLYQASHDINVMGHITPSCAGLPSLKPSLTHSHTTTPFDAPGR